MQQIHLDDASPPPFRVQDVSERGNPCVSLELGPGMKVSLIGQGSKRPHKHKDPPKHDVGYIPHIGPWNQDVRSLCCCALLGPYWSCAQSRIEERFKMSALRVLK